MLLKIYFYKQISAMRQIVSNNYISRKRGDQIGLERLTQRAR